MSDYFLCPNCEARVPADAAACPECGSDERNGLRNEPVDTALPSREEDAPSPRRETGMPTVLVVILLIAVILMPVRSILHVSWTVAIILAILPPISYLLVRGSRRKKPATATQPADDLYETLVARTRGDRRLADRLIEYERRRSPEAEIDELLRDAIDRLDADRR